MGRYTPTEWWKTIQDLNVLTYSLLEPKERTKTNNTEVPIVASTASNFQYPVWRIQSGSSWHTTNNKWI